MNKKVYKGLFYKHYKGSVIKVIDIAKHTETGEELVIYYHFNSGEVWARPLSMWFDEVITESGEKTTRFVQIHPAEIKEEE